MSLTVTCNWETSLYYIKMIKMYKEPCKVCVETLDKATNQIVLLTRVLFICLIVFSVSSCRKLIEIPPPSAGIADNNVYSADASAIAAVSGLYISMSTALPFTSNRSISLMTGLSGDELSLYSGVTIDSHIGYYRNSLSAVIPPVSGSEHWSPIYNFIFRCNAAIEGVTASTMLTPIVKQQLLGESKFMRAFFYFYVLNLFGDAPLALTTDPKINTLLPRMSKLEVYKQIIKDLKDAEELLSDNFLTSSLVSTTIERVRPTKWAAAAMLARVYLYNQDWAKAEEKSSSLISNNVLFGLVSLNNVFLKNSNEAIWQIQPTTINFNTQEARTYIIISSGPSITNPVFLSNHLLNSFETNDQRAKYKNWIDTITVSGIFYQFPYKYKVNSSNSNINTTTGSQNITEYFMILRLAEQYLIRSEARAMLGRIVEAQQDLNVIRVRAGLPQIFPADESSLLTAILKERRVELFCEWGHRWFDLKRTGKIDEVMNITTPLKSSGTTTWQSYQALYPLPLTELQRAPNLVQNEGY